MIEIITDSTCDLPQPLLEQYHITVLPHYIIWGSQQFRDRVDLQPADFYRRLGRDPVLPTTAAIPQHEFYQTFQRLRAKGADEVIAVMISSGFSAAYQNAVTAGQQMDFPVHVFNSYSVTGGLGLLLLAAARMNEAGASSREILAQLDEIRRRLTLHVCLDTLEYLERGGRIGKATRLVGTLLQIKPIVNVNPLNGEVIDLAAVRTRRRALDEFFQGFFRAVDPRRPFRLFLTHGDTPQEAALLAERIQNEVHPLELILNITGPVLGIHTGPRALALAGYNE